MLFFNKVFDLLFKVITHQALGTGRDIIGITALLDSEQLLTESFAFYNISLDGLKNGIIGFRR